MYTTIFNPQISKWVSVKSKMGKITLGNYVNAELHIPEQAGGASRIRRNEIMDTLRLKQDKELQRIAHSRDPISELNSDLEKDACIRELENAKVEKARLLDRIASLQRKLSEYETPKAVLISSSVRCKTTMGDDGFLIDEPEGCSPQVAFLKAEREAAMDATAKSSQESTHPKKRLGLFSWLKKTPASISPSPETPETVETPAPAVAPQPQQEVCAEEFPSLGPESYQDWMCRCREMLCDSDSDGD